MHHPKLNAKASPLPAWAGQTILCYIESSHLLSNYVPLTDKNSIACSDDDVRLARRIQRDVVERGRTMEDVLQQYARFVKPSHVDYIAPSKRIADIVIPWQHKIDNLVAVDLIVGALALRMHVCFVVVLEPLC